MENITNSTALKIAIQALEIEHEEKGKLLKKQFYLTYESLKPSSILNSVIQEIISPDTKDNNLTGTLMSLATGYVSNRMISGNSSNPIRRVLGSLVQYTVSNIVGKNSSKLQNIGSYFMHKLLSKKNPPE